MLLLASPETDHGQHVGVVVLVAVAPALYLSDLNFPFWH